MMVPHPLPFPRSPPWSTLQSPPLDALALGPMALPPPLLLLLLPSSPLPMLPLLLLLLLPSSPLPMLLLLLLPSSPLPLALLPAHLRLAAQPLPPHSVDATPSATLPTMVRLVGVGREAKLSGRGRKSLRMIGPQCQKVTMNREGTFSQSHGLSCWCTMSMASLTLLRILVLL